MFSPLRNRAYRHLFIAQVAALLGTGMATVVLGLGVGLAASGGAYWLASRSGPPEAAPPVASSPRPDDAARVATASRPRLVNAAAIGPVMWGILQTFEGDEYG